MQKDNDLLMDEELVAAFIDPDLNDLPENQPIPQTPETPAEESWEQGSEDDLPGQLAVDVYETKDKLVIKARTAGVDKKDLNVSISEGILTISGTLSDGEDVEIVKFYTQECYWGEFTRTLTLPTPVKEDEVEAVLKDGVLTISFEKIDKNPTVIIPIK